MRLIAFLSDPIFSPPTLELLSKSSHELIAIITTPDVSRGRGGEVTPSLIAQMADRLTIPVLKPQKLSEESFLALIRDLHPDASVVAAYPKFLPTTLLNLPPKGCWNIHPSLLPRWRGAAPVQRSILAGDTKTGVSIMRMVEQMDAGQILLQSSSPISDEDDGEDLLKRLAQEGANLLLEGLYFIEKGKYNLQAQDETQVTLAPKLKEEEARIGWDKSIREVFNQIRGVRPSLYAFTFWRGKRMQILKARMSTEMMPKHSVIPGTLLFRRKFLGVICRDGIIELLSLKLEGKKTRTAMAFLCGAKLGIKESFTNIPRGND